MLGIINNKIKVDTNRDYMMKSFIVNIIHMHV